MMNTEYISTCIRNDEELFIRRSEDKYHAQIYKIAEAIIKNREQCPIVLLSGPSGSGKTTSAYWLEKYMDGCGIETSTISMDNYFKTLTNQEFALADEGKLDLESPNRVDSELFNEHMEKLFKCEPVEIPIFDFPSHSRSEKTISMHRKPNEIIIVEGIHALNPSVTGDSDEYSSRLYVSVRTRIQNKNGETLHPKYVRVLRRMLRDKIHRARDPRITLEMLSNVERGENQFIMPYKSRANYSIDSFHDYELCTYKDILMENIIQLKEEYSYLKPIEVLFNELESIPAEHVPADSLMREFVGGSIFHY